MILAQFLLTDRIDNYGLLGYQCLRAIPIVNKAEFAGNTNLGHSHCCLAPYLDDILQVKRIKLTSILHRKSLFSNLPTSMILNKRKPREIRNMSL